MSEIRDAVTALLSAHGLRTADGGQDGEALRAAFAELAAQGWTRVGLPEELGGVGGTVADAVEVAMAATYLGAATPLADQVLIANAAAGLLGIALPETATCVLPVIAERGAAARVAWASWASHLLVADRAGGVSLVAARDVRVAPGTNLAGLPSDAVELDSSAGQAVPEGGPGADAVELLTLLGAVARSVQIAAALRRCQELSVSYARQRRQFGRALADLPVIQQELAVLAGEVAAAEAASRAAVTAVTEAGTASLSPESPAARAVAAGKVRTGLAATAGARIAHQIHGAIGITREYELHVHTRSLWAWRDEYGAERSWARRLGETVKTSSGGLWASMVPAAGWHD
jgi:alkylation response protein AidB-like acyl-CoA dehydrogenase